MILLGIFLYIPSFIFSSGLVDSLVMNRLFSYKRNFSSNINETSQNFYLKYTFRTIKRNPTLFFIPTMFSIAKGERNYIGENIGTITFKDIDRYEINQQIVKSTIPHNRKTMSIMTKYIIPNLYGVSLFDKYMLSPFNYNNHIFYRYRISNVGNERVCVTFSPKLNNTQLVKGFAIIDKYTGRIIHTRFQGEQDMISFEVNAEMGDNASPHSLLPQKCDSKAVFKFMDNEIRVRFFANFNTNIHIPDSISNDLSRIMDSIRPDSLDKTEKQIYQEYFTEESHKDSSAHKKNKRDNKFKKIAWDILGDHILNSLGTETSNASINFSPLFNPLYLSYSNSRGIAYKMHIGARYNFSSNRYITFEPRLGYNFKIRQFYFNAPLRFTYNHKRNGWFEFTWANGNRITNSSVLDIIRTENRDTIDFSSLNLDYFNDEIINLSGNIRLNRKFDLMLGCVYHRRSAVNKAEMELVGKPTEYRSFAPVVKLTYSPYTGGPIFTANYERSILNVLRSNIEYERWEFDASFKKSLRSLRQYSLRIGGGFYTNKSTDYFVDFSNFHENYLPGGWSDDWTGNFQLLNSQWYNASKYYIRTNASYESPLLLLTWIPIIGKYIETERIYVNLLQIEHTRPYTEVGYGLTNRYFSIGLFGSFLNGRFHEFGSKFTFELFRKW